MNTNKKRSKRCEKKNYERQSESTLALHVSQAVGAKFQSVHLTQLVLDEEAHEKNNQAQSEIERIEKKVLIDAVVSFRFDQIRRFLRFFATITIS